MPSPIGHTLAGIAVGMAGDRRPTPGFRAALSRPIVLACAALAMLPDLDLAIPGAHRKATHSLLATLIVMIVASAVTGWVTRNSTGSRTENAGIERARGDRFTIAVICGLAYGSHLLTDWLGMDLSEPSGIQLLWPFDDRFFISGWDLFPRIERRQIFSAATIIMNLKAALWEIAACVPIVFGAWWLRRGK
jgi:membrane-bound metal-dependent hydrolase YbcI (DUF457 family)